MAVACYRLPTEVAHLAPIAGIARALDMDATPPSLAAVAGAAAGGRPNRVSNGGYEHMIIVPPPLADVDLDNCVENFIFGVRADDDDMPQMYGDGGGRAADVRANTYATDDGLIAVRSEPMHDSLNDEFHADGGNGQHDDNFGGGYY